jgi:hypothetical protein
LKISIIIGFRNRDIQRVKYALDSLAVQSIKDFEFIFIDYGSDIPLAKQIETFVGEYDFVKYYYSDSRGRFWNRAHAINIGFRFSVGEKIFISDIDIIYHPDFLKSIAALNLENAFYTFSCYNLPEGFDNLQLRITENETRFHEYNGMGLSLIGRKHFSKVCGYDEFFIVWGAEDDDLTIRLSQIQLERKHISLSDTPIYHQWHPTHAPFKPTAWYLLMVNYLFSEKQAPVLNNEWGKYFSLNDRPVLKYIDDKSYNKKVKLDCWPDQTLIFFNPIIDGFHKLKSGEVAYFDYTYKLPELIKSGRFPFFRKNKKAVEKISKKDITQFFQFFLGSNRSLMQDYFYEEKGDRFLFVCIKK